MYAIFWYPHSHAVPLSIWFGSAVLRPLPISINGDAMPLTDIKVKTAKPMEKAYKLADGGGMYLLVKPNGSKYWRLKYRIAGKEKLLSIGV